MIETRLNEAEVERVVKGLAPDVVRIRFNFGRDWSDDAALYFRVVLSDAASQRDRLAEITAKVRERLINELGLPVSEPISYFRFRSESEQAQLKSELWA